jgi:hypothetical protein
VEYGVRGLLWTDEDSNELAVEATDFAVRYEVSGGADGKRELRVVLAGVWEAVDESLTPDQRRVAVEDRLSELTEWVGTRGTLEIDPDGGALKRTVSELMLVGVRPAQADNNALVEYDMEFAVPTPGGVSAIARTLSFRGKDVSAQGFLVEYEKEDRTEFIQPFRAAPVRVSGGPGIHTLRVTAVGESAAGATPLAQRQAVEALIREWKWQYVGTQGELVLDGMSQGVAHLRSIQPGDMGLPGCVAYTLEFVVRYAQGTSESADGVTLGLKTFRQETPSAEWTVAHNLGCYPHVAVVSDAGAVLGAEVTHVDLDNLTLTFETPVSGKAVMLYTGADGGSC